VDLRDTPQEQAFRIEVRDWLRSVATTMPERPDVEDEAGLRTHDSAWQRMLFDAGFAGIDWPVEFGGRGASPAEHLVFLEELAHAQAPPIGVNFVGQLHAGPTLMVEGTPEQRARHLPAILRGDQVWCQGFSEPDAGSDLASLRTLAVRDGDDYVVTGQKIWTSHAGVADFCELLVRTDPDAPKHKGITWLILPMDLPGIEIRPLRTMAGSFEFSELFLDQVRVPVRHRVGAENDGWRVAMVTFAFERGTALVGEMLESIDLAGRLGRLIAEGPAAGAQRVELAMLAAELEGLWALTRRNIAEATAHGTPGVGGSVFKFHYAGVRHRLGQLAMEIIGRAALSMDDVDGRATAEQVDSWMHSLVLPIAAGTSQVQANIIAERVLGLPKER
jgi:alkylation response protein AidB-like acyl-CoA dehydrogenase